MRRASLLCAVSIVVLAGCGKTETAVVVATLPAKAQLCPAVFPKARPGTAPKNQFDARRLVGHKLDWSQRLAGRFGCTLRITSGDGAARAFTADNVPSRIDIAVHRGVVTSLE